MEIDQSIKTELRFPNLREYLQEFTQYTVDVLRSDPSLVQQSSNLFLFLMEPWLWDLDPQIPASFELRRNDLISRGFPGDRFKNNLSSILENDEHLRRCCGIPVALASLLGTSFINFAINDNADPNDFLLNFDAEFEDFSNWVYKYPVKKFVLSHLYNFDSDQEKIEFESFTVVRYDRWQIINIVGEYSFANYLHILGTGDYFMKIESDSDDADYVDWISEEVQKAILFSFFLQYFKDGVVSTDYSIIYHTPNWVTQLRRTYFFPIYGDAHRFPYKSGEKPYYFTQSDVDVLREWIKIYEHPAIRARAENEDVALRKTIAQAGDYYEASHLQKDESSRLVYLSMALESLFSPSSSELRFRISQYASQLIERTAEERHEKFKFLMGIYNLRSKIVHGTPGVEVDEGQNEALSSIVRRSILAFFVLYLNGINTKDEILGRLERAALDSQSAEELRQDIDLDHFITRELNKS